MSNDFKNNITNNIKKENEKSISNTDTTNDIKVDEKEPMRFEIGKKQEDKNDRVQFPFYTDKTKQKDLDKVCKKTGYSRNELINMMIDFCLENIKYTD